ncbi:hypothetical protein CTAM01_00789 [Colletotrichum tamarilloi]|uniref:Uncharacterized protein n=1 Tax=Colletotrichum tamarilloi TaxID=1209934 RepID=A0ABQ9RS67_9PEZI|nr:uncharacterized protein CTAM01_00789 [Colletotrichum tamarilloi]KAK1511859.1 hypothetical protein CTAM01_00789 [Colletotrichum tamarilloi]
MFLFHAAITVPSAVSLIGYPHYTVYVENQAVVANTGGVFAHTNIHLPFLHNRPPSHPLLYGYCYLSSSTRKQVNDGLDPAFRIALPCISPFARV